MKINVRDETWLAVKEHALKRIATLQREIEDVDCPDQKRRDNVMRIAELRALLGLEAPEPQPKITSPDYN